MAAGLNLLVLGLFATAAGSDFRHTPRNTRPHRKPRTVSAESIFGAIGAFTALNERPPLFVMVGAAVIFSTIALVSLSTEETRDNVDVYR